MLKQYIIEKDQIPTGQLEVYIMTEIEKNVKKVALISYNFIKLERLEKKRPSLNLLI